MNIGLIGTITQDEITYESGSKFKGIGGILYQAAVLCGLKKSVILYTTLGQKLVSVVEKITKNWATLSEFRISHVAEPGNQVFLEYPAKGERVEILKSVVPPLNPYPIIEDLPHLEMLVMVFNSGFDIEFEDWRRIIEESSCLIWLDIHSLVLTKKLNSPREYLPLIEWKEWAHGVSYLQANRIEVASMLGFPDKTPDEDEIYDFGRMAFESGVNAVFVTLGKEGVLVMTPQSTHAISSFEGESMVDTTGCGDVFCAGTVAKLLEGFDPFGAASFGQRLATKAASLAGVEETYILASKLSNSVTQ